MKSTARSLMAAVGLFAGCMTTRAQPIKPTVVPSIASVMEAQLRVVESQFCARGGGDARG
jgi:hypothetical protein